MQEEDQTQQDLTHFERLRHLTFFAEFEDIELWEVLRISVWRELSEKVTVVREGDNHRKFGVIVDGFVEISSNGRVICRLRPQRGGRRNGVPASDRQPATRHSGHSRTHLVP
jgi:hypothetical protein